MSDSGFKVGAVALSNYFALCKTRHCACKEDKFFRLYWNVLNWFFVPLCIRPRDVQRRNRLTSCVCKIGNQYYFKFDDKKFCCILKSSGAANHFPSVQIGSIGEVFTAHLQIFPCVIINNKSCRNIEQICARLVNETQFIIHLHTRQPPYAGVRFHAYTFEFRKM